MSDPLELPETHVPSNKTTTAGPSRLGPICNAPENTEDQGTGHSSQEDITEDVTEEIEPGRAASKQDGLNEQGQASEYPNTHRCVMVYASTRLC
jgi:hypothetical protein